MWGITKNKSGSLMYYYERTEKTPPYFSFAAYILVAISILVLKLFCCINLKCILLKLLYSTSWLNFSIHTHTCAHIHSHTYVCAHARTHTHTHKHIMFRISQNPNVLSNAVFMIWFSFFQGVSLVLKLTSFLIIFKLFTAYASELLQQIFTLRQLAVTCIHQKNKTKNRAAVFVHLCVHTRV